MTKFNVGDIIRASSGSDLPRDRDFMVMKYDDNLYIEIGYPDGRNLSDLRMERSSQMTPEGYWHSHENNYVLVRRKDDACGNCKNSCRHEERCVFYQE